MKRLRRPLAAALLGVASLACGTRAAAQRGYFGQNQVQYETFQWKVLETDHFLVHYYPEIAEAARQGARMAERSYARLSRLMNHQFREKKPLVFFASRGGFGQNNITGDQGEGTGGVTDALRQRAQIPFTGDYRSFEHVLAHEMVHVFQYDIFARGQAGAGLQTLAQVSPPLWFIEGMAEYLTLGPDHSYTRLIMRDAALNGHLPSVKQMTERPDEFFPYRYGMSLWAYVGSRWGDEAIGEIMNAIPNSGVERAFRRELGLSLDDLGEEWKESLQATLLPQVAVQERPRKFAQAMLNERKTGGALFVAPALSEDGNLVAFISTGSFLRGEVFPDLWLADARTGKRLKRLVKTTTNADFEELRLLYSQSSFSPDGRTLAFTAQKDGRDVLYLLEVRTRRVTHVFDHLPLAAANNPTWSPDGRRIVFSGNRGGLTDLYMIDRDGRGLRELTHDEYGDLMPQWSPDGRTIAFVSDRGPGADLGQLKMTRLAVTLLDLETGAITTVPGQAGLSINPMWAPDGKSIAYISDRNGTSNVFLYDLATREHYQLTNLVGGAASFTEFSPALTWAKQADKMAFVYFENGDFTVWSVNNPRQLKKQPYRVPADGNVVASIGGGVVNTPSGAGGAMGAAAASQVAGGVPVPGAPAQGTPGGANPTPTGPTRPQVTTPPLDAETRRGSFYRMPGGIRASSELPTENKGRGGEQMSVMALLDSSSLALPDGRNFRSYDYRTSFQPEYVAQPTIGYAQDNFGRGVFGGTTIVFSDLLGNSRLAIAAAVNGRISEAQVFAVYQNLGRRWQWNLGVYQQPQYFYLGSSVVDNRNGTYNETQTIYRRIDRTVFGSTYYPLNRFSRWEVGLQMTNTDQAAISYTRQVDLQNGLASGFQEGSVVAGQVYTYFAPFVAFVSDNTLFGYTGPLSGHRMRFQVTPYFSGLQFVEGLADYRRYDPILFGFLTFASRFQATVRKGPDEALFPMYIGRPWAVRGYDRENAFSTRCLPELGGSTAACSASALVGSRTAFANLELRFPLVRRFDLGILPISLPPLDGLFFYDVGLAWNPGQKIALSSTQPDNLVRTPLSSYGFGLRLNLFNIALLRWDYAIPMADPLRRGYWVWTLGQSF
ncbi:MAG: PD40 domain-containing protein [Gemmatimonadetes bacterium]|nr:PD40 domain-containing protein [Gemmatimonadota bacterium]